MQIIGRVDIQIWEVPSKHKNIFVYAKNKRKGSILSHPGSKCLHAYTQVHYMMDHTESFGKGTL